jgi:hypothetical protein
METFTVWGKTEKVWYMVPVTINVEFRKSDWWRIRQVKYFLAKHLAVWVQSLKCWSIRFETRNSNKHFRGPPCYIVRRLTRRNVHLLLLTTSAVTIEPHSDTLKMEAAYSIETLKQPYYLTLWNIPQSHCEMSQNIISHCEMYHNVISLWNVPKYYLTLWNIPKYYLTLWNVPQYYLTLWNVPKYYLTLWNVPQYYLTLWNVPKYYLTPWNVPQYYLKIVFALMFEIFSSK